MEYYAYGEKEITYLKKKDKRLAVAIDAIGYIERPIISDVYQALINSIIGQQISTKAHQTIWSRMLDIYGNFTPKDMYNIAPQEIQKLGMTMKKANYIKSITIKIVEGEFKIDTLATMDNQEVCEELVKLDGVGIWTAEMIMLHSMQRKDILSYGDLAIIRGLRMLHHHRHIDKNLFNKYKRRYSPYGSVASLYLWAISAGAIPELKDLAIKK